MKLYKKDIGDKGELEVVKKCKCPNCGKKLMQLPPNYPLCDIQCTGCNFRAQVKTINKKEKNQILGAGWDIIDKITKSGYLIPALIINYKWDEKIGRKKRQKQKILFFPFIPKQTLTKYKLGKHHRQAGYKMFHYTKLDELPKFVLYKK